MTEWIKKTSPIDIGDTVRFSIGKLHANGKYTYDMAQAKGVVKDIDVQRAGEDVMAVAHVEWDKPEIPERVNVTRLAKVESRGQPRG